MFISGLTPVKATSSMANTDTSVVQVGLLSDWTYWNVLGSEPDFNLSLSNCLYSNFRFSYATTCASPVSIPFAASMTETAKRLDATSSMRKPAAASKKPVLYSRLPFGPVT